MQFSLIHRGTFIAIPLFSKAEVPCWNVPSSEPIKALTGILSPSCLFITLRTFLIKSGSCAVFMSAISIAFFQDRGISTLIRESIPLSTEALFIRTISSPFNPYVFAIAFFKYLTASSILITFASLKNAACIIIFILLPRPISAAILVASII